MEDAETWEVKGKGKRKGGGRGRGNPHARDAVDSSSEPRDGLPLSADVGPAIEQDIGVLADGHAAAGIGQSHTSECSALQFVDCSATRQCPHIHRQEIEKFLEEVHFGKKLCRFAGAAARVYDRVAQLSRQGCGKETSLQSKLWSLRAGSSDWLRLPVNLSRRCERSSFQCKPDIYDYQGLPARSLIVDFANKHIGGGCFSSGFVQEEQMVMQSTDFAVRLHKHRQTLTSCQGISYEGVHMDAWWPRAEAAKKEQLAIAAIQHQPSNPLTIFAVDAPLMRHERAYSVKTLHMLAAKVLLVFAAAEGLGSPMIFSGLLGGGAFRNNRPLVLLLHLLLQPDDQSRQLVFHHPIFWAFGSLSPDTCERNIVGIADEMMEAMREKGVRTLGDALNLILSWRLPLAHDDGDLV